MFVSKAAVIGGGARGGEIAQAIAAADIPVVVKDVDQDVIDAALEQARAVTETQLARLVEKEKLTQEQADARLAQVAGLVVGSTANEDLGEVDIAIEAVSGTIEVTQAVFAELDAATPGHAILASATASLPITEIGEATLRPEKVVGLHFLDPASAVPLVEVVVGEETSRETATAAYNFAQAIKKQPIVCGDRPGFVVGRVLSAGGDGDQALIEACELVEEGVCSVRDLDVAMLAGGALDRGALPPFLGADAEGLDTALKRIEAPRQPVLLRRLVAQGRLGKESGQGFYPYPQPDGGEQTETVKLETRDKVAIAWLANAPMNAVSPDVIRDLGTVWERVKASGEIGAMVIASSAPAVFSAGADIKAFTRMDESGGEELIHAAHALFRDLGQARVATIAAVNALAFGGGCELAMACDVRIAAEAAVFGQPEVKLGIIPGFGGTQRLPRLVGPSKALEMNLVGDAILSDEALELGLANRIAPDHELLETALMWGRKLAGQAPVAIEQIKLASHQGDLDEGIEAEKRGFAAVFASEDAREGIGAFLAKRTPRWKGK